jgi:hypothetical protein
MGQPFASLPSLSRHLANVTVGSGDAQALPVSAAMVATISVD